MSSESMTKGRKISVLGYSSGCAGLTKRQFSPDVYDICFDQNEPLDISIKREKKWLQWNFCLRHFTWGCWNLWDHREIKENIVVSYEGPISARDPLS